MTQGRDAWMPEDLDESEVKPKAAWEEISPESLRRSALSEDVESDPDSGELLGEKGMAWFEIVLGVLLGLVGMIGGWYWSDGAMGILVVLPALLLGLPLMMSKRKDLKYLGYGLLVSLPIALVLGVVFWYLTLFL